MPSFDFSSFLCDADALIIVPPFAILETPSLGVHLLQACAKESGFRVKVIYANLAIASEIGRENYSAIWNSSNNLSGETFFSRVAYGIPNFYKVNFNDGDRFVYYWYDNNLQVEQEKLKRFEEKLETWTDAFMQAILKYRFKIIGSSTTFGQTAASVAFLERAKHIDPGIITIIGGANCDGEMSEGILTLSKLIDYAFSGESEISFCQFLQDIFSGKTPQNKVISGIPHTNLDRIPVPDYSDYFQQVEFFLPELRQYKILLSLPYETSRGCWWGQKNSCTFCGLNGSRLLYREKSPDKVIEDLKTLLNNYLIRRITMTDNVIPYSYFKTLLPRLEKEAPDISVFYEVKANFTLSQMILLKKAGISEVQPGIESLSTSLLRRMNKGVTARQNLAFLRYVRSVGINAQWNLLYGFPGDTQEEYIEIINLIRIIQHLHPPSFSPLSLARFSKYYYSPEKYGIKNLRPGQYYDAFLPPTADIARIAIQFEGDFDSFAANENNPLLKEISHTIREWQNSFKKYTPAKLELSRIAADEYLLLDTRGLPRTKEISIISQKQAIAALTDRPVSLEQKFPAETEWAIEQKLIVELDSWYISLVTANPDLILEFESIYPKSP